MIRKWTIGVVIVVSAALGALGECFGCPRAAAVGGVVLLAAFIMGCSQTEQQRAAYSMIVATENANLAEALHNAHVTTPAQEAIISPLLDADRDAVNAYYAAINSGDSNALATAKASLAAASAAAAVELAKYKLPTTQPATQPATATASTQKG